jgi:hypothetical protein
MSKTQTLRHCRLELDWTGLDWKIGLDWIGLDWIGLDWIGLDWIGLDWIGLDWIGLDWIGLDWIGLDWMRSIIRRDTRLRTEDQWSTDERTYLRDFPRLSVELAKES